MAVLTGLCLAAAGHRHGGRARAGARAVAPDPYGGAALAGGWFALRSTAKAHWRASAFDVNLLMILAAIGAGSIGYMFEAAVLMFLFSLSNTLEVYTMGRTRRAPARAAQAAAGARAGAPRRRGDRGRSRVGARGRARDREAGRSHPGGRHRGGR
jgi:cation transport ATPase